MQTKNTIDTAIARRMVEANAMAVHASIIGQSGGWSVMLKIGMTEKMLGVQRTNSPRIWRSLDRCVEYLKKELHIAQFDRLDATHHVQALGDSTRTDAAERMRHAHQSAAHDKWFRAQVEEAIIEADNPNTVWVSNDDAKAQWASKRAVLAARIKEESV